MENFDMPQPTVKAAKEIDEIVELFSSKTEFEVGDKKYTVRCFNFGELPMVLQLIKGVAGAYFELKAKDKVEPEDYFQLISIGGENLMVLLAKNLRVDRKELDTIEPDVGLEMMAAFVAVNLDFFMKRVLPMVREKLSTSRGQ